MCQDIKQLLCSFQLPLYGIMHIMGKALVSFGWMMWDALEVKAPSYHAALRQLVAITVGIMKMSVFYAQVSGIVC